MSGTTMGMIALFAGLALVLGGIAVADQFNLIGDSTGVSCGEVQVGNIHEHAEIQLYLNSSQVFDFSPQKYQLQSDFIHFEQGQQPGPDTTAHIHSTPGTRPSIGCMFSTLGWQVSEDKIVTDTGETYPVDENHELTILVDGEPADEGFAAQLIGGSTYEIRYEYTGPASGGGNQSAQR